MLADITVSGCNLSAPVCGALTIYFVLPLLILIISFLAFISVLFFGVHIGGLAFIGKQITKQQRQSLVSILEAAGWKQTMPRQSFIYNSVICSIGRRARVHTVLQQGNYTLSIVSVRPRIGFMLLRRHYVMLSTTTSYALPYMLCLQTDWRSSRLVPPKNTQAVSVESNDFERKYALFVDTDTPQFTFEVLEPLLIEQMQAVTDPITLEISGNEERLIMPLLAAQKDAQLLERASKLLDVVHKNVIPPKRASKQQERTFVPYRNVSAWMWLSLVDLLIFSSLILQDSRLDSWQIVGALMYHSSSVIALAVVIGAILSGPKRKLRDFNREKY